jgi:hypothetical protein
VSLTRAARSCPCRWASWLRSLTVLVVEFADALVRESEALPQRCDGSAFGSAVRVGGGLWICGEPADVVAELGLGVEPGAGNAGTGGDIGDGESLSGLGEVVQGSLGTVEGVGAATLGGRDEMVTVVRHRIFLPGSMFRRSKDRRRSCSAGRVRGP